MTDELIAFMYESWASLDAALEGVTAEEAVTSFDGASRFAWTLGHVSHMIDSWLNVNFQGLPTHPIINDPLFYRGASGATRGWEEVIVAVDEVRTRARRLLDADPPPDLERVVPYRGSIEFLRPAGLRLRYALMRISAHHFMHAGEIMAVRSRLGHQFPESPEWGLAFV